MFAQFKAWYQALSPRRRTAYSVLVAIIVATVPCYCIGGWALLQGLPRRSVPAVVPTSTTFLLHALFAQILIIIIPFSKIMHWGGIFFTQALVKNK